MSLIFPWQYLRGFIQYRLYNYGQGQKSTKPFLRIEIQRENPEIILRPFKQKMPYMLNIMTGQSEYVSYNNYKVVPGYKRFENVTIETEVSLTT